MIRIFISHDVIVQLNPTVFPPFLYYCFMLVNKKSILYDTLFLFIIYFLGRKFILICINGNFGVSLFYFWLFHIVCCCCFVVSCFVVNVRVSIKKKPFLPFVFVYFITYNFLFFFLFFFDSHVTTTTTNNNCTQFIQMKNSKRHTGRTLLLFIYTFWCTAPSDGKWTKKTTAKKTWRKKITMKIIHDLILWRNT